MQALTPAQKQYHDLKNAYPDCVLLFRMGDFYETFYDDAHIAHEVLHITLTSRDKNSTTPVPMAWIPYHALERYLPKLIKAGHKVAIAEQQGAVVPGKIVTREVTQVITPGTFIEDGEGAHYIAALVQKSTTAWSYHLARGDVSLWSYRTKSVTTLQEAVDVIKMLEVKELLLDPEVVQMESKEYLEKNLTHCLSVYTIPHNPEQLVCTLLGVSSLQGYGQAVTEGRIFAIAQLLSYLNQLKGTQLRVVSISYGLSSTRVLCDPITYKNLEIFHSSYDSSSDHTVFGVLNTCATAMGARCLHARLSNPTRDSTVLQNRLDQIEYFFVHDTLAQTLYTYLKRLPDMPRLLSKILHHTPSFMVVVALKRSLATILTETVMTEFFAEYGITETEKDALMSCYKALDNALSDDSTENESYIKTGYSSEIDKLRQLAYHADDLLLTYQQEIQESLWIALPKIRFVTNQWYFLEVTKKDSQIIERSFQKDNPKSDFVRRQTLKTWERYVTTYLQELQTSILDAQDRLHQCYESVRSELVEHIRSNYDVLMKLSDYISTLDVAISLWRHSKQYGRCKPRMHEKFELVIEQGKHPVVDAYLPRHEQFIPNDLHCDRTSFFHLITWPNMGGKSTYLRQNAIIVLLAHCGCRVPAKSADIPLVDGIFARVWSGDVLAKNQSTFLTEMLEMANILNNATAQSFVVLDELGRWTATYDWLSLAKSICVYLIEKIGCKSLFATHYHELQNLEKELRWFTNKHVTVYENDQEIIFLKKIASGGADRSYGLEVAKLAWIPSEVIANAKLYLQQLQQQSVEKRNIPLQLWFEFMTTDVGTNALDQKKFEEVRFMLESCSLEHTTPLEALMMLETIKKIITDE